MANEKEALLRHLIDHRTEQFSILKLAQLRKINYKSAYNNMQKLSQDGSVYTQKLGNTTLCSFAERLTPLVYSVEWQRRLNLTTDLLQLSEKLKDIPCPLIALLFGSHAKRKAKKHSDIDVLIITEHETEVVNTVTLLPLPLHVTYVTYNEFITMVRSHEFSVVSEVLKHNIILQGIEEYYRLLAIATSVFPIDR